VNAHDAAGILAPAPARVETFAGRVAVPDHVDARLLTRLLSHPADAERLTHGWVRPRISGGHCGSDMRGAQSFELCVTAGTAPTVTISSPSLVGARHGLAALAQLLIASPRSLPAMRITDRPAIVHRGVMLDVSRTRVPTVRWLTSLLDDLALMRINHLQLYFEHTFAYEGHEEAWRGSSPITPDQLAALDDACRDRGIELAANQNCFGHLAHWLRLPRYARLAETHGDWMFDAWPRSGPFSLCPTDPGSLELARDWIAQMAPCVRSLFFNIGCDETYDIAYGRSKATVAERGRLAVFTDFVCKLAGAVRGEGKTPLIWGDMVFSHAAKPDAREHLERLRNAGVMCLAWNYEPDAPFAGRVEAAHGAGMPCWACPGTSSWRAITGRTTERRANINDAATSGADGLLLCDWGDSGHWQQWIVSIPALAQFACAAWSGTPASDERTRAAVRALLPKADALLPAFLDALGDADLPLREVLGVYSRPDLTRLRNQTALFASLFQPPEAIVRAGHSDRWRACAETLTRLRRSIPTTGDTFQDDGLAHTLDLASFAATRALACFGEPHDLPDLHGWLDRLAQGHARLWCATSRTGELPKSLSYFDRVRELTPGVA